VSDAPSLRCTPLALALAVLLAVAAPATAVGLWRVSTTPAALSLAGGTLTAPTLACTTAGLGLTAQFSWNAVPGAAVYVVSGRDPATGATREILRTTTTSTTLTANLLNGVLGTLLELLLGGGRVDVVVEAEHVSGWRSPASNVKSIERAGLVGGLLGGVRCAP
jgi:hypothetical protein